MNELTIGGFVGLFGAIIFFVLIWLMTKAYQNFVNTIKKIESFNGMVKLSETDYDAIGTAALERVKHSCRYTRIKMVMGYNDFKELQAIGFQLSENHFMGDPITCSVRVTKEDGFEGMVKAFEMLLYAAEDPHNKKFRAMTMDDRSIMKGMDLKDYETVVEKGVE